MDHHKGIRGWTATALLVVVLFVGLIPISASAVAEGEEGLSQVSTDATPLTSFEKQALVCRSSPAAEALLTVGSATALDRAVLNLGTSAVNDWCVYLKTHLENDPSHIEGLNPGFGQCLMRFFQAGDAAGTRLTIHSGYRSNERQAELYAVALQKYGSAEVARKWVAPPGSSKHNIGLAADLRFNGTGCSSINVGACEWAHLNAAAFGLTFRLGNEPWHIEPTGGACQEGEMNPSETSTSLDVPAIIADVTGTSNVTMESLIQEILSQAQQQVGQGLPGEGSGTKDIFGTLFNTITDVFTQQIESNTGTQGTTEYLVISEDGTLLAQSNVSAQDALTQASAYYNPQTTATSSQGRIQFGGGAEDTRITADPFQLGERISSFLSGNTFSPSDPTSGVSGQGNSFGSGNIIGTLVQSFMQQIFGFLGSLFGQGGR